VLDPAFRRALAYVFPYWRRLVIVVVLSLASTVVSLYIPLLSRDLVDDALLGNDVTALVRVVTLFIVFTVVGFGLNLVSGLRYTRVSAEILFDMRLDLYCHLQRLSPRFYAQTKLGEIVSRINNDIGEIQRVAAEVALAWVGNVLFLFGAVIVMAWLDLRLFLVGIAFVPVSMWALVRYRRLLEGRVSTLRECSADIGSFLIETLQAMSLVVTSNAEGREVSRFRRRNDRFIDALMKMQRVTYLSGGLPGLILGGSTALVFLYGGLRYLDGALTFGVLVAVMAYQARLLAPIRALMGLYANLATAKVSLDRVHQIADAVPEVSERDEALTLDAVQGTVTFEDVSFAFDRGVKTLDGVSFRVEPGETVAIVGASGTGKSTIADLLVRLFDPDAGAVRLDGHDLRDLTLASLRRFVAVVDQEPFVFHASIMENIRYARPEATNAEVETAARAAGLHDFIAGLPERHATVVGERGAALSAGERQRLAIARALLTNPMVLVLDEATAALDPATERRVIAGYEKLMHGRTTIVISHRGTLAYRADRVLLLEGARIVEEGPPARLLAKDGAFAALFRPSDQVVESPTGDIEETP
jgi:ATP-binding cassette subfamily B protein